MQSIAVSVSAQIAGTYEIRNNRVRTRKLQFTVNTQRTEHYKSFSAAYMLWFCRIQPLGQCDLYGKSIFLFGLQFCVQQR